MVDTLTILDDLVGFPTVSAETNLPMIAYLRDFLEARGFDLHQIDDPTGHKAGLFATIGPKNAGGVMLSGHTDVVPTGGQDWSSDPFKMARQGTRVVGRGTTDMKGYLASMLVAADKASKLTLKRPLKLSFSYDEEIGCVGMRHMIGSLHDTIGAPDVCIVGEPTSMRICVGHKGKAAFKAHCTGQNGHSAMAPDFRNALHVAADFIVALRQLQQEFADAGPHDNAFDIPYTTLHAGRMSGGIALNLMPERAVIDWEYRNIAAHDPVQIEVRLVQIAAQICEGYGVDAIRLEKTNAYPGLATAQSSVAVSILQGLVENDQTISVPFGTEAGLFSQLGIPTVVCGPGSMSEQGHKPDESLEIAELHACDVMHKRVLQKLVR